MSYKLAKKTYIIDIPKDKQNKWISYLIWHDYNLIYKILKEWRENLPDKNVLDDLKKLLNNIKSENVPVLVVACSMEILDLDFYKNLIYFGADIYFDVDYLDVLQIHCFKSVMILRELLKEAKAGRIIVRAVKKALDDEFYLTELRKKIDLTRYLKLVN